MPEGVLVTAQNGDASGQTLLRNAFGGCLLRLVLVSFSVYRGCYGHVGALHASNNWELQLCGLNAKDHACTEIYRSPFYTHTHPTPTFPPIPSKTVVFCLV